MATTFRRQPDPRLQLAIQSRLDWLAIVRVWHAARAEYRPKHQQGRGAAVEGGQEVSVPGASHQ